MVSVSSSVHSHQGECTLVAPLRRFIHFLSKLTQVSGCSDKRNLFGEPGLDADGNSRYFDSLLDFMLLVVPDPQGIHGLHMVEVVTSFSILRRNFRNVSATSLIPILRSLPRLQEVRFEPWQQVDQPAQEDVDSGKAYLRIHRKSWRTVPV